MPKRYDTTFFLALSTPTDQPPAGKVDGKEIKSLGWFTPADALTQFSDDKITLFPPQWYDPDINVYDSRYILSDLTVSSPRFSDLVRNAQQSSGELRPIAPQSLNSSTKGFTMVLQGDEKYTPDDGLTISQPGARHRVIIISENGRPRRMHMERNINVPVLVASKL